MRLKLAIVWIEIPIPSGKRTILADTRVLFTNSLTAPVLPGLAVQEAIEGQVNVAKVVSNLLADLLVDGIHNDLIEREGKLFFFFLCFASRIIFFLNFLVGQSKEKKKGIEMPR